MRIVGVIVAVMALGCGGNYGHVPVFGGADACLKAFEAYREHALACGAKQNAGFDALQRSCDNSLSEGALAADVQPCLDAIAMQPCSDVNKVPQACRDAFAGLN